jgi:hypothetical protein
VFPHAITPAGAFLATLAVPAGGPGSTWDEALLPTVRLNASGAIEGVLAVLPAADSERFAYYHRFSDGRMKGADFPFAHRPEIAIGPDGARVATASVVMEDAHQGRIDVVMHNADGDTVYARSFPFRGEPISRAARDSAVDRRLERIRTASPPFTPDEAAAAAAAWRRRLHVPVVHPPIAGPLVIDQQQRLWLRVRQASGTRYMVLDRSGVMVGSPALPGNARLMAANEVRAWAVEMDEWGVPSLIGYRIVVR